MLIRFMDIVPRWPQTWKTWNAPGFWWIWKTRRIRREFCATREKL